MFVLRIKSKKGKYFLLLKDFYYFIIFILQCFSVEKCHLSSSQLNVFVLTPFCPLGPKFQTAYLAEPCMFAVGERRHQVFVRGSVELIYGTTDDAMNCFMGPHF